VLLKKKARWGAAINLSCQKKEVGNGHQEGGGGGKRRTKSWREAKGKRSQVQVPQSLVFVEKGSATKKERKERSCSFRKRRIS